MQDEVFLNKSVLTSSTKCTFILQQRELLVNKRDLLALNLSGTYRSSRTDYIYTLVITDLSFGSTEFAPKICVHFGGGVGGKRAFQDLCSTSKKTQLRFFVMTDYWSNIITIAGLSLTSILTIFSEPRNDLKTSSHLQNPIIQTLSAGKIS